MIVPLLGIALAITLPPMPGGVATREPQMAANGTMVALAFGAGNGIYFRASHDAGATFSAPIKVAEASVIPLTRHRGPRVAFAGDTIVISAVVGKSLAQGPHAHGLPSDGDLMAWRSTDGGRNWSEGVRINDVAASATEGLHALAGDGKGRLFTAWLDKRGGHGTKLFGARSTDGGITWSNSLIYESPEGTICECCHPSAAIDSDGQILVMWRNWLGGARDLYLALSGDGITFSRPAKLGTGTWRLNACPMDGGGLAVFGVRVVTAWRREHEIFLASPGAAEVPIEEGVDVAVAAGEAGTYAVWSAPSGIRALVPGRKAPITVGEKGAFPSVIALADGRALAAWEDDGKIVIRQLR